MENKEKIAGKLPSECTTIIVGEEQSVAHGARYLCRSSDFDALMAINVEVHRDTDDGTGGIRGAGQQVPLSVAEESTRLHRSAGLYISGRAGVAPDITRLEWE